MVQTRLYPSEYEGHLGGLLISHEEIETRIKELAQLIHEDYKGTRPVMLCTLKGACPVREFFVTLARWPRLRWLLNDFSFVAVLPALVGCIARSQARLYNGIFARIFLRG